MQAFLTGNALKILAAVFMTIDHVGAILFPRVAVLRLLGRLAMPIFAFMIAEGCKYTKNRKKYFGMIFILGTLCQIVYYLFDGSLYLSILMTFSLSILMIYSLQFWKEKKTAPAGLVFIASVAVAYILNRNFEFDYGFWGCMLPVFATLAHGTKQDSIQTSVLNLGIGLLILSLDIGGIQIYSMFSLFLLLCYNGRRGKRNLKYFFYIFYPTHLAVLDGIAMLMAWLR